MLDKVINLIKQEPLVIPKILLNNYRSLNITELELVVLIYLLNNKGSFNPKFISSELNLDLKEFMQVISNLTDKGLIKIEIDKKLKEEYINIDELYHKLAFKVINEEQEISSDIYSKIENEFGRTLSPMEYEIINGWVSEKFSNEIIIEALKEATFNGVSNLRYIDKILYEWKKKGIKNPSDIRTFQNKHREKKESIEIFDYDWLEGEDR